LSILRFFKLLSLSLWLGSIFFFAAVVAPTAFSLLPSRTLAGMVVGQSLSRLHWIGIVCGLVFLLSSFLLALIEGGQSPFHSRDLLLVAMMAVTLAAHFGVERRMNALKADMGVIDVVPQQDARRVEFNRLHVWSTRLEGSVFFCGLALLFLVAREESASERRYYRS
jgi:magnesium-transporting ATPase (P-type)